MENDGGTLVLKVSIHSEMTIAENNMGSIYAELFSKCSLKPLWTLTLCDSSEDCLINIFAEHLIFIPKENETVI